jgi:hypothetical protein
MQILTDRCLAGPCCSWSAYRSPGSSLQESANVPYTCALKRYSLYHNPLPCPAIASHFIDPPVFRVKNPVKSGQSASRSDFAHSGLRAEDNTENRLQAGPFWPTSTGPLFCRFVFAVNWLVSQITSILGRSFRAWTPWTGKRGTWM